MALRGNGAGGYRFDLPDHYDQTADLSAFLWMRRGSGAATGSRIFNLVNADRTHGFIVHVGSNTSADGQPTEVLVSVSSRAETSWGSGRNQRDRGRATLEGLSETEFCPLAFSVRGSAAPDNTGSDGAQQLHEVWWKGEPAAVANGSVGSGVSRPGGRVTLLCREPSNLSAFDGWVAEVAVWQDYRLSAEDAARLSRGTSPLAIALDKLLFYRSCRQTVAAEAGDATVTPLGAGAHIDPAVHPPLLIEGSVARHGMGGRAPLLTIAETVALAAENSRHAMRGRNAALAAAGRLGPLSGRSSMTGSAPSLLSIAGAAETLRVSPDDRWMAAGWP